MIIMYFLRTTITKHYPWYVYVYTCISLQETYKIFIEISLKFELLTSQIDHKALFGYVMHWRRTNNEPVPWLINASSQAQMR